MNGTTRIDALTGRLRSGEMTARDAFSRFVEAGRTLAEAAELTVGAPPPSPGRGASGASPPIFYNGLTVESTTRCNAKCGTCYQYAGPGGSDLLGRAELTPEEIARTVVEASQLADIVPRFHLSGGEAFLAVDSCVELLQVARVAGFFDIMTTTNAYWARTPQKAGNICRRLREAGLTRLEISWDYWHLPFIRPATIGNCIRAGHDAGMEVMLHVLTTKSHSTQEALDLLPRDCVEQVNVVMCGPVMPIGRAAEAIDPDEMHGSSDLGGNCHAFLNLAVNPFGEVSPCCAGLDHTDARLCGNVRERPLASIVAGMSASPLLRTLVLGGVARLRPILEQRGLPLDDNYRSICHMCWSIFSDPARVEAVKSHFDEFAAESQRHSPATDLAYSMSYVDAQGR